MRAKIKQIKNAGSQNSSTILAGCAIQAQPELRQSSFCLTAEEDAEMCRFAAAWRVLSPTEIGPKAGE